MTAFKVKVREQGCRFVLSQGSKSLFLVNNQWGIIFSQLILKCNLCKYTVLYKSYVAYNFR